MIFNRNVIVCTHSSTRHVKPNTFFCLNSVNFGGTDEYSWKIIRLNLAVIIVTRYICFLWIFVTSIYCHIDCILAYRSMVINQRGIKEFVIYTIFSYYSNKSKILERRLRYLKDHFQYQLYDNVSRSIFAKHRGVFTFILCANLLMWVTVYKGTIT